MTQAHLTISMRNQLLAPIETCYRREGENYVTNVGLLEKKCTWVVDKDPRDDPSSGSFLYDPPAHQWDFPTPEKFTENINRRGRRE